MIQIQQITFPEDCILIHHEFYTYDPEKSYSNELSYEYLGEDLLQCTFEEDNMIIDLGWYGNIDTNKGEFKLQLIKDENWEIPFEVIYSKSVDEIKAILVKIISYYTSEEIESEID